MDLQFTNILSEGEASPALQQQLTEGEFWLYQSPFTIIHQCEFMHDPEQAVCIIDRMEEDDVSATVSGWHINQVAEGTDYDFYLADVGHSGKRGVLSEKEREGFDTNGIVIPWGNPAGELLGKAIKDGKFQLSFNYNQKDQPVAPTGFKLYEDSSALNLIATIPHVAGRVKHTFTTLAYSHASSREFLVRTYRTVAGTDYEDQNLNFITLVADDTGPTAIATIKTAYQ